MTTDMRKILNILNESESGNPYDRHDPNQNRLHAAFNRGWDSEDGTNPYDKTKQSDLWVAFNKGHAHRNTGMTEQADADDMYGDSSKLNTFGRQDGQEFSDRGRGKVTQSAGMDARFADNPMFDDSGKELDEFVDVDNSFPSNPTQIDRLHSALIRAGQSDQSIMQGLELTDRGKQKLAASLGLSPEEIGVLLSSLSAELSKDEANSTEALLSDYYTTMGEGADVPMVIRTIDEDAFRDTNTRPLRDMGFRSSPKQTANRTYDEWTHPKYPGHTVEVGDTGNLYHKYNGYEQTHEGPSSLKRAMGMKETKRPFDQGTITELLSYEPDVLGNVTIRDLQSGDERYIQGTQATTLLARLRAGADEQSVLAPLMETNEESPKNDFMSEIEASSGTYNFPWTYDNQHGLATVMYHAADKPVLKLVSVRDDVGNEIEDVDSSMHNDLLQQARDFIGHE